MKDIYGWILTTVSLWALTFETINQILAIIISLLSIAWLVIRIIQQLKNKK